MAAKCEFTSQTRIVLESRLPDHSNYEKVWESTLKIIKEGQIDLAISIIDTYFPKKCFDEWEDSNSGNASLRASAITWLLSQKKIQEARKVADGLSMCKSQQMTRIELEAANQARFFLLVCGLSAAAPKNQGKDSITTPLQRLVRNPLFEPRVFQIVSKYLF